MKKTMSLLLVVAMLLCMIPAVNAASHPFTDVKTGDWYASAVEYCYTNNLMNGTSDTIFAPDNSMTRAMLVTVLYRIEGTPSVNVANPFGDVKSSSYYYSAVLWAYANDITKGTDATHFAPDDKITREQMVTFFYRYAQSEGCYTSDRAYLSGYLDSGSVASYAVEAFQWAVATGIINGTDTTHLSPAGTANRAQCATIIQRYVKWGETGTTGTATAEEKNALDSALSYLSLMHFSYNGLIGQLEFEGYSNSAAVYAADHCGADWNEQALKSAKNYLDLMAFSYSGLIDQLEYEEYTTAQATYAADKCGADWFEQAVKCGAEYLALVDYSRNGLIRQLEFEGFTNEQAVYGADQNGL